MSFPSFFSDHELYYLDKETLKRGYGQFGAYFHLELSRYATFGKVMMVMRDLEMACRDRVWMEMSRERVIRCSWSRFRSGIIVRDRRGNERCRSHL